MMEFHNMEPEYGSYNIAYMIRNEKESVLCQKMLFDKNINWNGSDFRKYTDLRKYPSVIYIWNNKMVYSELYEFENECELVEFRKILRQNKLERILNGKT